MQAVRIHERLSARPSIRKGKNVQPSRTTVHWHGTGTGQSQRTHRQCGAPTRWSPITTTHTKENKHGSIYRPTDLGLCDLDRRGIADHPRRHRPHRLQGGGGGGGWGWGGGGLSRGTERPRGGGG